MKTIKKYLNAAAISIAVGTLVSVLLYSIHGPLSFKFVNPFTVLLSPRPYTALHSLIAYSLIGIFFESTIRLFDTETYKNIYKSALHFLSSFILFYISGILSVLPWGISGTINELKEYYGSIGNHQVFISFVFPILLIIFGYILCWFGIWLKYNRQISIINKKINEK